jgi:hypothetical protein
MFTLPIFRCIKIELLAPKSYFGLKYWTEGSGYFALGSQFQILGEINPLQIVNSLNLSILLSEGKETNWDFSSNGE